MSHYATEVCKCPLMGLEIFGISIVDADAKDSVFLKAEQTFTDKKRGRKPDFTKGMKDPDSLTGWYLRMLNQNPVAQRCNGGSIYCKVRKISEHAIK